MFYYLCGKADVVDNNCVVIDCGGVGYLVYTSFNTVLKLGSMSGLVKIYTYASIREDAFDIYGFLTKEELDCFKMLIGVSGVGPKAAIAILSSLSIESFIKAIADGDFKKLTQAQGIGIKLAQRIVLELKDKITKQTDTFDENNMISQGKTGDRYFEAKAALMALGYSGGQATDALRGVDVSSMSVEDIVRKALKILMR